MNKVIHAQPFPPPTELRQRSSRGIPPEPDRNGLIRERAYFRAQARGFAPGHELEDWLAAEREVDRQLRAARIPLGFYG